MLFALLASVGYGLLYNVQIHQRLSAEEVCFKYLPASGVCNQKIDSRLCDLEAHKLPFALIGTLGCEAVSTAHVAIVADVQTKRLQMLALNRLCKSSGSKEQAVFGKFLYIGLDLRYSLGICTLKEVRLPLHFSYNLRSQLIADVQRRAFNVEQIINSVDFKRMNHNFSV